MAGPAWKDYLDAVAIETARILEVADDLDRDVPTCPGWTLTDLLVHLSGVSRHAVESMRSAVEPPWPLTLDTGDPRALLRDESAVLLAELNQRGPYEARHTWWPDDQTSGFWFRHLAHEYAVHRVDAEIAAGRQVTPVDDDLALDGVDEFLTVMLGGPWWEEPGQETAAPVDARAALRTGTGAWLADVRAGAVDVVRAEGDADVVVSGPPHDLFLWLWGRAPASSLVVVGRTDLVGALERRFAEAAG